MQSSPSIKTIKSEPLQSSLHAITPVFKDHLSPKTTSVSLGEDLKDRSHIQSQCKSAYLPLETISCLFHVYSKLSILLNLHHFPHLVSFAHFHLFTHLPQFSSFSSRFHSASHPMILLFHSHKYLCQVHLSSNYHSFHSHYWFFH